MINNYLKFDKSRMVNLEYSLEREILRTNRRGAYHSTTLVECNTRKQHGLLVMPVPALDNSNHVLLSSLDETVIQHGAEFNLGIHKYDGNHYSPMGHKYIREFSCDSLPKTVYRVGGVVLSKEKMFSLSNNQILIRYTLLDAHSPTTIRFRPFLAFREINQLTQENSIANHGYKEENNGISMCMYAGYPRLFMQFNKSAKFVFEPNWNKGIEYIQDQQEGFPYKEDLYVPGYFELPIKKGESIIFVAGDTEIDPKTLVESFEEGVKKRTPRSSFYNCLKNSAHQFYYRPNENELYFLNGYPWGRIDARAQFLASTGLTIGCGRPKAFEEVVDTTIPAVYQLLKNQPVTGYIEDMDAPDALLCLVHSLNKFADVEPEIFKEKYSQLVLDIIQFLLNDKHPKIHLQKDGLLYVDEKLDSRIYPVSDRRGCLVEMNVLWYNSLMFGSEVAQSLTKDKVAAKLETEARKIKGAFLLTFVNDYGYLYDYVDGNYSDLEVRHNMLFAVSSRYGLIDRRLGKSILDIVTKELLTPKGIRSLSPKSANFRARYEGDINDKAFFKGNGAAYPSLLVTYLIAYKRIFQRSGYSFLDRLLIGVEDEMSNSCIGSLSEMYDGSLPYCGHGAISDAKNVAGVLSALDELKKMNVESEPDNI